MLTFCKAHPPPVPRPQSTSNMGRPWPFGRPLPSRPSLTTHSLHVFTHKGETPSPLALPTHLSYLMTLHNTYDLPHSNILPVFFSVSLCIPLLECKLHEHRAPSHSLCFTFSLLLYSRVWDRIDTQ